MTCLSTKWFPFSPKWRSMKYFLWDRFTKHVYIFVVLEGTSTSLSPLHPNVSMHILHTVLYTSPKMLTRRICWTIKTFFSWWLFPLFSWSTCVIQEWYFREKLDALHSQFKIPSVCLAFTPTAKNVAADISEKLCDSVATKLEGKVLGTFSGKSMY